MPLGVLLSLSSRSYAGMSSIYLWLVVNNADLSLLQSAGFWYTLLQILPALLVPCFIFGCFAWTAGALLAGIARRTLRIHCVLFCLALLCANAFAFPEPHRFLTFDNNAPVHANVFYRSVFPLLLQFLCILLPALLGMRQVTRTGKQQPSFQPLFWASILICTFLLAAGASTFWWLRIWALPPLALAAFAAVGPAGYLLTQGHFLHRRQRA
jgi:hypothetical protein